MAHKWMKKCPTFLVTKEIQIKTSLRFHFILARMVLIKCSNNTNAGEGTAKHEPLYMLVGMKTTTTTMESNMEIPQKTTV
jgi:hypothetical protein